MMVSTRGHRSIRSVLAGVNVLCVCAVGVAYAGGSKREPEGVGGGEGSEFGGVRREGGVRAVSCLFSTHLSSLKCPL